MKGDEHLGIFYKIASQLFFVSGGQDFDSIIMNHVYTEYRKTSTFDIFGNKRLVKRLRTECRAAKEALSFNASSYNIHVSIIKNNRSSEL